MRKMRKFLNILFLCTLALGLSSCEPDDGEDYYIYDTLLGGIWVGDLGFADAYILRWKAGFTLKATGWEEMSRRITTIRMERWHSACLSAGTSTAGFCGWTTVTIILCWKSTTYMLRETDCPAYYTWTGTWMGLSCWKGNIKNMDVRTS